MPPVDTRAMVAWPLRSPVGGLVLAVALSSVFACRQRPTEVVDEPLWVATPAPMDVGATCSDVLDVRACWSAPADGGGVVLVPRPVPTRGEAWRCMGERGARTCRRRAGTAGPFACGDGGCTQEHPRMPDDGEWECFERGGAVVCSGGEPAAGVVGGRRDESWVCGERRGDGGASEGPRGSRVCIDLAPDRPADLAFVHCVVQHRPAGARQVCAATPAARLGAACDTDGACPAGATCASHVCLPSRAPRGECWQDADCGSGQACLFTTCTERR